MSDDLRLLELEKDGKKVELYIKKPSAKDIQDAQFEKAMTFKKGINQGLYMKKEMDKILKERGVWDEEAEKQLDELQVQLEEKRQALEKGGIKLSDAKKFAIEANKLRNRIIITSMVKRDFAVNTADGMADQAELDYLVSACVVYNTDRNKKYFKDYQDYLNRKSDDDAFVISQRYAEIMYDTIFDEKRLPENEFLLEHKFVNDDLRLVNSDGHLVDEEGNLINEDGEKVKIVKGKEVVVEKRRQPFLDDDGNPIE